MSRPGGTPTRDPTGIRKYIPMLAWLPGYGATGGLRADVVAGISLAALLIPESLGYAEIAGVPPEIGLYAAPAALILYAIFGGSRLLVVATASAVAAVSAGIVGSIAAGDEEVAIAITAALAIVAGLVALALGVLRMGWVSNFMSKAVLEGFIVGLSISIIIGQLDAMAGVHAEGESAVAELGDLVSQIGSWDRLTLALGLGSLGLLFAFERFMPKLPAALAVVGLGIALVSILDLQVAVVGEIPRGLPQFGLPQIGLDQWLALIPGGMAIVLVGFSEGFAAAKDAAKPHERLDANQELIGLGASSVGAGLSGGMVVSGSLSKTAASKVSGATSQVANIVSAGVVLLTLLVLAPLFTNLPEATLGAVVIHAVWRSADPRRLAPFGRVLRAELGLAIVVLATVLFVGEIAGVILGDIISLLVVIYRISYPRIVELGRDPLTGGIVGLDSHPQAVRASGVVVARFDAPLIYSNAETFKQTVLRIVSEAERPGTVVIDAEAITDIDSTGGDALVDTVATLRELGSEVRLVRVHTRIREALERGGMIDEIGPETFFSDSDLAAAMSQAGARKTET